MCKGLKTLDGKDRHGHSVKVVIDTSIYESTPVPPLSCSHSVQESFFVPQSVPWMQPSPPSIHNKLVDQIIPSPINQQSLPVAPSQESVETIPKLDPAVTQMQLALTDLIETVKKQSQLPGLHNELAEMKQQLTKLEKTQTAALAKQSKLMTSRPIVNQYVEPEPNIPRPETRMTILTFENEINKLKEEEKEKTRALRELRELLQQERHRGDAATAAVGKLEEEKRELQENLKLEQIENKQSKLEIEQRNQMLQRQIESVKKLQIKFGKERSLYQAKLVEVCYLKYIRAQILTRIVNLETWMI